ncbi:hypothetical protein Pint_02707 [Pistacia integerrima]|uniref:Uncharacterized protein n=1 Tax=Pistacia integerrima TaxID=434235 RepID=A0ACC0ZNQ5_9ROSI|nr:hypothetical protein Pint_02707 [Pistacia integerrima]
MDKQEQERKEEKQEQKYKEEQEQEYKEEHEQPNEHEQEKELGKEHELQHTNSSPDPPPKQNSPPPEPELRQTYPSSPPKQSFPPRLLYHNSTPNSPPLGEDEEEEEDHRKPPFKLPPPPAVAAAIETKVEPTSQEVQDEENGLGGGGDGHGHGDGFVNTGSGRNHLKTNLSILKKAKRDSMMKRALIVSRISGFVFSLVSFSVLAADRDRGWAIDSFYRYKEFRYCMAVNVIAFVYSGFQGYDLIYQLTSGKRKLRLPLRHYLDFSLDQVIAYLLMSASSSAAVRVDDWQSNWGKDPFPDMARASVALSFLAFAALALSSLISGYKVYTLKSL